MALTYLNSEMIDEPAKFDQLYVTSLTALTATIQNTLTNDLTSFNVTDSSIISVNSVNDALRITQIGTGNVLVVEDSQNPDSTPFIIKNDGKVGIGVSTPVSELDVRGSIRSTSSFGTNFIVLGDGNVGINLQAPTVALDVVGDAKFTGIGEFNSVKTNSVVLPIGGGGSVINDAVFLGNVTFLGGVSALSGLVVVSSSTTQTSALSVINASPETALYVDQLVPNLSGIAIFVGSGVEVLRINNPLPNPNNEPAVVVNGELSAGRGTSTDWNNVYSTVRTVSSVWGTGGQTFTTVSQASSNWQSTYTTVRTNSANWNTGGQTYTTVSQNSSDWIGGNRAYTTVSQNSGNWQSTYSLMQANSATLVSLSAANLIKFTYTPLTTATIFSVAGIPPTTNSTNYRVDINGVLQEPDSDYAISGTNIVMTSPVAAGDKVVIVANTPIDIVDITTPTTLAKFSYTLSADETTFSVPGLTNPTSDPAYYRVDINGVLQEPGTDYTINGANVVMTSPAASGDKVVIVANTPINIIEIQSVNTQVETLTGNWQSTYTNVQSNSANWESSYTTVQSYSALDNIINNLGTTITDYTPFGMFGGTTPQVDRFAFSGTYKRTLQATDTDIAPQLAIETTFVGNSSLQLDFAGAPGATIPVGLYVQHEQTGSDSRNNAFTHSIMGYGLSNAAGNNDVIGVTGRVIKTNKAGNIGDAGGLWGSAYQLSQENGGVMALEAAIYQNVAGSPSGDRLGPKWSTGVHAVSISTGSPATAGVAIDAQADVLPGSFGFWNGIIIDRSCYHGSGIAGTVGINCGSWNELYAPQYGIKFGSAYAHIYGTKNITIQALSSIYIDTSVNNTSIFTDLGTSSTSNLVIRSLNTSGVLQNNHAVLQGSNGFVGLGTIAPNERLTVSGNISATGRVYSNNRVDIVSTSTNVTFTNNDSGKIYHFDTTAQSLCAIFPTTNLADGFNVTVVNTGTQNILISSNNLKSIGTTISEQYGSAYVYEYQNSTFATGRLI